jgi:hypothetical protein
MGNHPADQQVNAEYRVEAPTTLHDDELVALRAIVEGTAGSTGARYLESLVGHLAAALGVSYAFVAEFAGVATRVRTIAYWGKGQILPNVEYDLAGTPCEDVPAARFEHFALTVGYMLFFLIHITQVMRAGWNNFRAMVIGVELSNNEEGHHGTAARPETVIEG